jgi:hypothetical protein
MTRIREVDAGCCAAWERSLNEYRYPVDLRRFSLASEFQPRFFNENICGDRASTRAFESRFRSLAPNHIEAWAEVTFWKMYSQRIGAGGGRAGYWARRVLESGADPRKLWNLCLEYVKDPTRENLDHFKSMLFSSPAIATASTYAAFADEEGRLPIVDRWIATWVAANRDAQNNSSCPPLLNAPPRTPQLWHSDFVRSWIDWSRCMAKRLSNCPSSSLKWTARDIEMAVFQAARSGVVLPVCQLNR